MKKGEMNKKGAALWYALSGILALVVIFGVVYYIIPTSDEVQTFTHPKDILQEQFAPSEGGAGQNAVTLFGNVLGFIIGKIPDNMIASSGNMSSLIILICFWIMLALLFGDVLRNFSTLSSGISWAVAVLMVVIAANLNFLANFVSVLTGVFIGLGVFAVYASLLSSFLVFFAVEWGIGSMAPWVMRRKGMQRALKSQEATQTILDAITHYKQVGRELSTD